MKAFVRASKFPYFFWSFNKAYECEIDFERKQYYNLEKNTSYDLKPFNFYSFLLLKYFPTIILIYLTFNIYDFNFNKRVVTAYMFAVLLVICVNAFENATRTITTIGILIISGIVGFFMMEELFLIAYVLKYFIFISIILLFSLDVRMKPYSLVNENNKVLSHILLPKHMIKQKENLE